MALSLGATESTANEAMAQTRTRSCPAESWALVRVLDLATKRSAGESRRSFFCAPFFCVMQRLLVVAERERGLRERRWQRRQCRGHGLGRGQRLEAFRHLDVHLHVLVPV